MKEKGDREIEEVEIQTNGMRAMSRRRRRIQKKRGKYYQMKRKGFEILQNVYARSNKRENRRKKAAEAEHEKGENKTNESRICLSKKRFKR